MPSAAGPLPQRTGPGITPIREGFAALYFSVQMYLMWNSGLTNAIPVPLGYVSWGFSGGATLSNGSWSIAQGSAEQQRLAGLRVRGSAGRRQESLRFTAEKTLSIKQRFPYCSVGKLSRICRRAPHALRPERRLAGMIP